MTRYLQFNKKEWANLRAATPMTLSEADLKELRGINEKVSLDEVAQVYLPLSRLLNLYVAATQQLSQATDMFLGLLPAHVPYVIGIGGSVAVGKSTPLVLFRLCWHAGRITLRWIWSRPMVSCFRTACSKRTA